MTNLMFGLSQDGNGIFEMLTKLFPDLANLANYSVAKCSHDGVNETLCRGVAHCLVYGSHDDLPEVQQAAEHNHQDRACLRSRVLHRKRTRNRSRSRSRSRSPSPERDITCIEQDCIDTRGNEREEDITMGEMAQNPEHFELDTSELHNYLEPHIGDAIVTKYLPAPNHTCVNAVLVVEVSPARKCFSTSQYHRYMAHSEEHIVQQLLAAISYGQNIILGLLILPDGIQLNQVRVDKNSYIIEQTDVIPWNHQDFLPAIQYISDNI